MGIAIFEQKILSADSDYDISMYRALLEQIIAQNKLLLKSSNKWMFGCIAAVIILLKILQGRGNSLWVNTGCFIEVVTSLFLKRGSHITANVGWYYHNKQNS